MGSRCGSASDSLCMRRRHYSILLLLLALAAVVLSVAVVHRLKEGRVLGLVIQDRERQLLTLQTILEKERARSTVMKSKIQELKAKAVSLRIQKKQLRERLVNAESLAANLKNKLASLKDVEAPTDLPKQQRDHAEEMEPSSQPINAALVQDDDLSNGTEADESTSQGEMAANYRDDDGQTSGGVSMGEENSEHEQGSDRVEWVRPETNANGVDDRSADEEDRGKEEISEEGERDEGIQMSGQNTVKSEDEDQINRSNSLLLDGNSTVDSELEVMQEEVRTSANTAAASEEGQQLENKDNNGEGEEEQTMDDAQQSFQHDTQAFEDSQTASFQYDQSSEAGDNTEDDQVIGGNNATGMSSGEVLQAELAEGQTSSAEAEAAEQQTQGENVSSEAASVGENYPATNGYEVEG